MMIIMIMDIMVIILMLRGVRFSFASSLPWCCGSHGDATLPGMVTAVVIIHKMHANIENTGYVYSCSYLFVCTTIPLMASLLVV